MFCAPSDCTSRRTLLFLGTLVALALVAAPSAAGPSGCAPEGVTTNFYEVLLDVDDDASTGGTVIVEQASEPPHPEEGIDAIVRLFTGCGPNLSYVAQSQELLEWNGASFELSSSEDLSYPLGIDLGPMDLDVVEWSVARSALPGCLERGLFHASVAALPKNDYSAEFAFGAGCGSVLDIPVGGAGFRWILAGLLGFAGFFVVRRMGGNAGVGILLAVVGTALCAGTLWGLAIMVDGDPSDWGATAPIVTDPAGDQSSVYSSEDMQACYVTEDGLDRLYFRCDVTDVRDTFVSIGN